VPFDLGVLAALSDAARRPAALSDSSPLVSANREAWTVRGTGAAFPSATAAYQYARANGGAALAAVDAASPVSLAGVV
jgi:hypothetical protein